MVVWSGGGYSVLQCDAMWCACAATLTSYRTTSRAFLVNFPPLILFSPLLLFIFFCNTIILSPRCMHAVSRIRGNVDVQSHLGVPVSVSVQDDGGAPFAVTAPHPIGHRRTFSAPGLHQRPLPPQV